MSSPNSDSITVKVNSELKTYTKDAIFEMIQEYEKTRDVNTRMQLKNVLVLLKGVADEFSTHRLLDHAEYLIDDVPFQSGEFVLSKSQRFLKKFMSPYTKNKSLLLFHGVGVGKTCSSIQIS